MAVKPVLATLGILLSASLPASATAPPSPDRMVLLGTAGGPVIRQHRAQISTLLEIGGKQYLVDCGEGCVTQLKKAGVEAAQIDAVFLTHLHLDHVAGLATLGAFAWAGSTGGRIAVHGPPGTSHLVSQGLAQFAVSEALFSAEVSGMGQLANTMTATEYDVAGDKPIEIYRDEFIRVTAVENSHLKHLAGAEFAFGKARSYAIRLDTPSRSIVFTGDTGTSPAVINLAKDADILVSEIMDVNGTMAMFRTRRNLSDEQAKAIEAQMRAKHMSPEDVGRMAQAAGVRMVVLSHDGSAGDEAGNARFEALAAEVRRYFSGSVVAGQDLQNF